MKNSERFLQKNEGLTQNDYQTWATEVGRKNHINKCDKKVSAKFGKPTDELIQVSMNYLEALSAEKIDLSIEGIIASNLSPFPKANFEKWGDKNFLKDVSSGYFDNAGLPLDIQANEMIEMYSLLLDEQEVIQEIINFVSTYRKGTYITQYKQKLQSAIDDFYTLTGFEPKDYYCQHLINQFFGVKKSESIQNEVIEKVGNCPF
jgi:hypothetical protein